MCLVVVPNLVTMMRPEVLRLGNIVDSLHQPSLPGERLSRQQQFSRRRGNRWSCIRRLNGFYMHRVLVDGKIHVIGGRTADNTENTNLHDVYDPATNSWQKRAPLPEPLGAQANAIRGAMFL